MMTRTTRHVLASLLFLGAGFVACGGHPGGTVGDPCDSRGSSGECDGNQVCDSIDDGSLYCLQICSDHSDCASGERCNGVSGNDLKACHPESDDDAFDDDGVDDCPFDDPGCGKKGKG